MWANNGLEPVRMFWAGQRYRHISQWLQLKSFRCQTHEAGLRQIMRSQLRGCRTTQDESTCRGSEDIPEPFLFIWLFPRINAPHYNYHIFLDDIIAYFLMIAIVFLRELSSITLVQDSLSCLITTILLVPCCATDSRLHSISCSAWWFSSLFYAQILVPIQKLINNLSRMEKEQWEGFESFGDQQSHPLQPKVQVHFTAHGTLEEQRPESQLHTSAHAASSYKKKIHFKPHTRRKVSSLYGEEHKKSPEKKVNELIRYQSRRTSVYIQKPHTKEREHPLPPKEQRIPIFRFPNLSQAGKLIYKGFLPVFARETIRDTTQSSVGDSLRNNRTVGLQEELIFNSKFESGNLDLVRKLNNQYHLFLAPDTNTKGHRQWFYFTLLSHKPKRVKLIIHGFKKRQSLFQKGMSPYGKKLQQGVSGWKPIGTNIRYVREQKKIRSFLKHVQFEYSLSFQLPLQAKVTYCIASCIPYTYSYLKAQLQEFANSSYEENVLCTSLMGLDVPLLTFGPSEPIDPRIVVINSRTHPGQSPSSWVADGIIQYLAQSQTAKTILQRCNVVIKIVPMLNPDGVYMGNYRTGIMGIDYNRLFLSGKPDIFPEVEALRRLVRQCKEVGRVDLFLDLHGHSINPGCFIYGPDPCFAPTSLLTNILEQIRRSQFFARQHCKRGADSSKTETARIFFQVNEGIYSLTCQNSLGLRYTDYHRSIKQFDSAGWRTFGSTLIESILMIYQEAETYKGYHKLQDSLSASACRIKWGALDPFPYKKYKTDNDNMQRQIESLRQLDQEAIDLSRVTPELRQGSETENDSDSESENLSPQKQDELFGIVAKLVRNRQNANQADVVESEYSPKKDDFRSRTRRVLKGQCLSNFKEYHFGLEDNSLNEWFTKKRLLSIPKVLKTEKINQSYIIRKSMPKSFANQLIFQSIEGPRKAPKERLQTETRDPERRKIASRLNHYRTELEKQKFLHDMQFPRKS